MNQLRKNTTAKALALLAAALFSTFSLALTTGVGILQSFDAYSAGSLAECRLLDNLLYLQPEELADMSLYHDSNAALEFRMKYAKEKNGKPLCNTVVRVTDISGVDLLSNYEAEIITSTARRFTMSYAYPMNGDIAFHFTSGHDNCPSIIPYMVQDAFYAKNITFRQWLFDTKNINTLGMDEFAVENTYFDEYYDEYLRGLYEKESLTTPSGYFNVTLGIAEDSARPLSKEYFAINGFEHRWAILVFAVICGIGTLAAWVFLALSAGWRPGSDRPVGTVVERIPLGLFLLLCGGTFSGLYILMKKLSQHPGNSVFALLVFGLLLYAMILTCTGTLHSLVARFKCKGWTRNTIIYRLYVLFGWIGKNLSDLGTALLCVGVWMLVNLGLLAVALDRLGLGLLLLAIFNLIAAAVPLAVVAQWQALKKAAAVIADGDSSHRIDTQKMFRHLKEHGESINRMGEGVEAAVDEQMKSERMKTDLITNVSHDLKTPLTSIVSYVGLLKNESIESETARGYISTLDRQATRLGRLIEDLVEASKATSGSIKANIMPINAGELLEQAVSEYEMRLEQSGISPVLTIHGQHLTALADGRLLWRVFDNLMSNVCKYGLPGTRLYIDAQRTGDSINVLFRNISASRLNVPAEELMERFVRGDSSRTTSGSGLGLTIARSLTELQNGIFSLEIDGDMFKAFVTLPATDTPGIVEDIM